MALLVSLVVSLVFIVILVIVTLAVEIDRLPDDPGNGRALARVAREGKRLVPLFVNCRNGPFSETQRCQGMRRAGAIGPRPFEAAAYASQRRKRPDYPD
jgi:hypothetical protein